MSNNDRIVEFINEELAVHEGGIEGAVVFSYDDATFQHTVSIGRRDNPKRGSGYGLWGAILDFKETHRKGETNATVEQPNA